MTAYKSTPRGCGGCCRSDGSLAGRIPGCRDGDGGPDAGSRTLRAAVWRRIAGACGDGGDQRDDRDGEHGRRGGGRRVDAVNWLASSNSPRIRSRGSFSSWSSSPAGLALLMVQYATRSARRSVPVGALGLVAAWVISSMWPWPLLQPRLFVPDWAAAESALKLSADPQSVAFDTGDPWTMRKRIWRIGRAHIRLEGIQPGWLPSVGVTGAVLELNPDVHLSSPGFAHAVAVPIGRENSPPLRGVVQAALEVGRLAIQDSSDPERAVVLLIRKADFSRYAPGTGAYRGRAVVELTREEVVATLPVQAGATFQDGAYRVVVDEVRSRLRVSEFARAFPTPGLRSTVVRPRRMPSTSAISSVVRRWAARLSTCNTTRC